MFPTINKKETGVNLRRIMDMRGVKPKDIQEYLGFGCVQSVYRWLDGVSMPTVDNLYAISKMQKVFMPMITRSCRALLGNIWINQLASSMVELKDFIMV